jgi:hypothetical protein
MPAWQADKCDLLMDTVRTLKQSTGYRGQSNAEPLPSRSGHLFHRAIVNDEIDNFMIAGHYRQGRIH